jgi:drug/metabolite transporter (DMT)-like permease
MPFLLALASAIFYGSADFLGGVVSRRLAAIPVVLMSQAAGLVVVLLLLPQLPAASATPADLWWGAAAGLTGGIGVGLLYYALAIGTMSVVAPATAVAAVAIPALTSIAFGERPGLLATVGIVLGVGAIVLVSQPSSTNAQPMRARGVGTALAAGVAIGLFFLTLAQTRAAAGLWPLVAARSVSVSFAALVALARHSSLRMSASLGGLTILGGLLDMIANALYMLAAQMGPLSPVVTLSSLYPAATVLLARAVFGERLSGWQWVGVVCALVAIVLIVAGGR